MVTRSVSFGDQPLSYQLCRRPVPVRQLDLEDLLDGEMRVGGSIRGAFSNTERSQYISSMDLCLLWTLRRHSCANLLVLTAKNFFRVSYRTGGQLQSHCFQASDAFNKQQWINCIRQAKDAAALTGEPLPETGQRLQEDLGGRTGPVLSPCCDLRRECEGVAWGETGSGRCLEVAASPSGDGELAGDGGRSPGTDTETTDETEDGAPDEELGAWAAGGGEGDARAEAEEDISASSCREDEVRGGMGTERSGAVGDEALSMDTGDAASPQREEDTYRC